MVVTVLRSRYASIAEWEDTIGQITKELDLARPVVLNKHVKQLADFGRTNFKQMDFIEEIAFDTFEIEIFEEEKKPDACE